MYPAPVLPYIPSPDMFSDPATWVARGGIPGRIATVSGDDAVTLLSEVGFVAGVAPSAAAITCTAAASANGTITLIIGSFTIVVPVLSTDNTVTLVAAKCVAAINKQALGALFATNVAGAITVNAVTPSPALNSQTIVATVVSAGATFGAATAFGSAGAGPVTPRENFSITVGPTTYAVRAFHPIQASGAFLSALQNSRRNIV